MFLSRELARQRKDTFLLVIYKKYSEGNFITSKLVVKYDILMANPACLLVSDIECTRTSYHENTFILTHNYFIQILNLCSVTVFINLKFGVDFRRQKNDKRRKYNF